MGRAVFHLERIMGTSDIDFVIKVSDKMGKGNSLIRSVFHNENVSNGRSRHDMHGL